MGAEERHAEAMLKREPKSARWRKKAEDAKAEAEEARGKIRDLRSPSDQLQHKLNREKKLTNWMPKTRETIRQKLLAIAETEEEVEVLREQLHDWQEEMELIASQKLLLVAADAAQVIPAAPVAPVDIAQCVTAMQSGLGEMFNDPRLSEEQRAKKSEVEAGFLAMRNLASMLSSPQADYETAKLRAAVSTATAVAEVSSSSDAPSPTVAETRGETAVSTEEASTPSVAVGGVTPAAVSPVPDGPSEDRSATRDRTPPPSKGGRKKAIGKMSDADLAGPRKAKGGNKVTA